MIFMMFYVYVQNENLLAKTGLASYRFEAGQPEQQKRNIQIVQE